MREDTLSRRTLYSGRVLALELLEVELEDGRRSVREVIRHARAVGVLARIPDGRFAWVRQYRKPVEAHLLEICAGLAHPDETPEAAARRELREETGLSAGRLAPMGEIYSSPGCSDESVTLFFTDCAGAPGTPSPDADERVELAILAPEQVDAGIRDGTIRDAKSVAAWLLYRAGRHETA